MMPFRWRLRWLRIYEHPSGDETRLVLERWLFMPFVPSVGTVLRGYDERNCGEDFSDLVAKEVAYDCASNSFHVEVTRNYMHLDAIEHLDSSRFPRLECPSCKWSVVECETGPPLSAECVVDSGSF
jgi:hypothetical protein